MLDFKNGMKVQETEQIYLSSQYIHTFILILIYIFRHINI